MHAWLQIVLALILAMYLWQADFIENTPMGSNASKHLSSVKQVTGVLKSQVNEQNLKVHLAEISGRIGKRHAGSRNELLTAEYCSRYLQKSGWKVHLQKNIPLANGLRTINVIAEHPGQEASAPVILLGAHLDSCGEGKGADDNGSGLVVLLEIARILSLRAKSAESSGDISPVGCRLVFFGGEEFVGGDHHIGSQAYVRELNDTQRAQIAGMISVDAIGGTGYLEAVRVGLGSDVMSRELVLAAYTTGQHVDIASGIPWSDHEAFEGVGIPAVWLRRTGHKHLWHTSQDTSRHVRIKSISTTVELLLQILSESR